LDLARNIDSELEMKRRWLSKLYLAQLEKSITISQEDLQRQGLEKDKRGTPMVNATPIVRTLLDQGFVSESDSGELKISPEGRKQITVVMAGGTFDIIHPGHVDALSQAKSLGNVLVVSVARNKTVEKTKGRSPVHDEQLRRRLVAAIRYVDAAILGSESDIFQTVELVRPDIVALGYDQYHTEDSILHGCRERGMSLRVRRLTSQDPATKTSRLLASTNQELLDDL
jgi:FAD synthetase